jgi:DNA-binding NarL/FixJ family response regulator
LPNELPALPSREIVRTERMSSMDGSAEGLPNGGGDRMRVIVADDDALARRIVKDVLQAAGIIVVAEAHDGRQAVELCSYYRPDVMVMDVVMPVLDGIAATRRILEVVPEQRIVMLTSSGEDELGMLGLHAGATGFLTKDIDIDALPQALRGVCAGEAAVSRRLGMRVVEQLQRAQQPTAGMRPVKSPLTAREWEVVDLLCERQSTDEIADGLVLARETVRSHVKNILRKLEVSNREEAIAVAQRMRGGSTE